MQYQKEAVRNKILASALHEFDTYGFSGAQMRRIAEGAGVATGNVYRYFKNKDEVFEAIVQPVYADISKMIFDLYKTGGLDVKSIASDVADKIMDIYRKYQQELLVITDKSQGSQYENFTDTLITLVSKRIKNELFGGKDDTDNVFTYVIASGFVGGIFLIMRSCKDPEQIKTLINRMLIFYFDHLEERLQ